MTQTPDVDPLRGELRHVQVGESSFGYHTFGTGPELVLFNGDAMCMSLWTDELLRQLSEARTVTIFDYPGLGQSEAGPNPSWDIWDLADLHVQFLATLELETPDLLGWSTGGEILLAMAARAGDKLGRIVSVAGDPGSANFVGDPNILETLAEASEMEVMGMLFPATQGAAMGAFVQDIMSRPQDEPTPEVGEAQNAAFQKWLANGVWDQLPLIKNRCLFINGTADELVPTQNAVNMASRVPGAWLVQIPEAGHAVLLQEPKLCTNLINVFLND